MKQAVQRLHKLMEEDPMVRFFRDMQTKEFLIAGTGQQHIEVIVSKLKKRYHTEVVLKAPKVPYRRPFAAKPTCRAAIRNRARTRQYGDCKIQNGTAGARREFRVRQRHLRRRDSQKLHPPVEKGIVEAAARGHLAGLSGGGLPRDPLRRQLPRRRLQRTLVKTAGRIAFRKAMEQAKPCLLEPIMKVEISVPDEFAAASWAT